MIETDEVVTLQLPAQARYIRLARLVGAGLANELGVDVDGLDDVRLAIGEVCALATQLGAALIDLQFELDAACLRVSGLGRTVGAAVADPSPVGDDHIKLVRQILDVACREHDLNVVDGRLSFSLTCTSGDTDDGG